MQTFFDAVQDRYGNAIYQAQVTVTTYPGGALATLFQDTAGTIPLANPFLTDADGTVLFAAANGQYLITVVANTVTDFPPRVTTLYDINDDPDSGSKVLQKLALPTGAGLIGTTSGNNAQVEMNLKPTKVASVAALNAATTASLPGDLVYLQSYNAGQNQGGGMLIRLAAPVTPDNIITFNDADGASYKRLDATVVAPVNAGATSANAGSAVYVVVTNAQTNGPNVSLGGSITGGTIETDISNGVLINPGSTGYNNVIGGDGSTTVNTTNPNVPSLGTGAHVSVIGGYDNVAGSLSSKIISDHSYTGLGGQGHNAIYGGATHIIDGAGSGYSMIAGGSANHITSLYSFATGQNNSVTANGSGVMGAANTVSGTYSFAAGTGNTASGSSSLVFGASNTAAGNYSFAQGRFAWARRYGQRAFASGQVTTVGDVQNSFHTVYGVTTDATPTTLGVDGGNTYNSNHQMLRGTTALVTALVVGRTSGGTVQAGFRVSGMAHFEATGNAALIGVPAIENFNPSSGCAATLIAALSVGQLAVQVTGLAATTIQWSSKIEIQECVLP